MSVLTCDVAIIGAGTAGLSAERAARRSGASTLLIDQHFAGTTCTLFGCMPSKLLIAAANAADAVRRAGMFGIVAAEPIVDGRAVMARVRRERDRFNADVLSSIAKIPDKLKLRGHARFSGPGLLALDDGRFVDARAIVIATGAAPEIPKIFAPVRDHVLTNETIFDLPTLPRSVGVVGAGALGLELAQALCRLGVEVAVFDRAKRVGGLQDEMVAQTICAILETEFPIRLGVELAAAFFEDKVMLSWGGYDPGRRQFDKLLVAAGRPPRLAGLGLDKAGIELDDHGTPIFDRATMQCGDSPIFIAGDADHDRPVLHEASDEGSIAGRNAALFPNVEGEKRDVAFTLTFTEPAIAVIGRPFDPADDSQTVGFASYADQGRATAMGRNAGIIRLYARKPEGRLIGAAMAGPAVEHTAHLIAWSIQLGLTAKQILDLPFYHPTYEEGLKPALRQICEGCGAQLSDRHEVNVAGA